MTLSMTSATACEHEWNQGPLLCRHCGIAWEDAVRLAPACLRCGDPGYRDVLGRRFCGNVGCSHTGELRV